MEAPIAQIHESLERLRAQQKRARVRGKTPTYFTNAVLDPLRVDIVELIRDTGDCEKRMYEDVSLADDGNDWTPHLKLRQVPVPLPLRNPTETYDMRSYLEAASQLINDYAITTRSGQRIQALFERDREVQRAITRFSATIENARKAKEAQARRPPPRRETPRSSIGESAELRSVKEEIRREKQDILALEAMLSELEVRGPGSGSPQEAQSTAPKEAPAREPSEAPAASPVREPSSRSSLRASLARQSTTPGRHMLSRSVAGTPRAPSLATVRQTLEATPRRPLSKSLGSPKVTPQTPERSLLRTSMRTTTTPARRGATPGRSAATPGAALSPETPASDTTPRHATPKRNHSGTPSKASPRLHLVPLGVVPEATPERERIAERIWAVFGENLRYVAPGCSGAPFATTFALLSALESCGRTPAEHVAGDALHPMSPLRVGTVIMAHVLLLLCRSPAPHALPLLAIKSYTDKWWTQCGRAEMQAAAAAPATLTEPLKSLGLDLSDIHQPCENLARTAVYGLMAKKLLRIRHAGGTATVHFA